MARLLRILAVGFVVLLVLVSGLFAAIYAAQPSSYRIARRAKVPCTVASLQPKVTDLRAIDGWMRHHDDPHDPPVVTFSPTTSGPGAWAERKDSQSVGRIELASVAADRVVLQSTNDGRLGTGRATTEIVWFDSPAGLEVELAVGGELSGLRRALWPVVNLEGRVGPTLEHSLVQLSAACRENP